MSFLPFFFNLFFIPLQLLTHPSDPPHCFFQGPSSLSQSPLISFTIPSRHPPAFQYSTATIAYQIPYRLSFRVLPNLLTHAEVACSSLTETVLKFLSQSAMVPSLYDPPVILYLLAVPSFPCPLTSPCREYYGFLGNTLSFYVSRESVKSCGGSINCWSCLLLDA